MPVGTCKYDITAKFSDETALRVAGALTGVVALQHLISPHGAYETYWNAVSGREAGGWAGLEYSGPYLLLCLHCPLKLVS